MRPSLILIACALALAGCENGSQRMVGTSTSVGTSIGGTAARSDGRPAAGALVVARDDEIIWIEGKPESRLLDSARADSLGRYRLTVAREALRVEIICDTVRACSDHLEVWNAWAIPDNGRIPGTRTARPGSLQGTYQAAPGEPLPWIGIAGTARFVRPEGANGRFLLEGLAPGKQSLTLIRTGGTNPGQSQKAGTWTVLSGRITETGPLQ
jgi:hypothetical protein